MKNKMYIEKYLKQLISFSQKGYFIFYNENITAFCFDKPFLLNHKTGDFGWKGGFLSRIRENGVFFKLG